MLLQIKDKLEGILRNIRWQIFLLSLLENILHSLPSGHNDLYPFPIQITLIFSFRIPKHQLVTA